MGNKRIGFTSLVKIRSKFRNFSLPLINNGISVYADGSRKDDKSAISAAIFSPELGLAIKHKLPSDASIFSAEA